MEIKFLNVSVLKKNKNVMKNLNLLIKTNRITGIYNDSLKLIPDLLTNQIPYDGNILIDNISFGSYQTNLISYLKENHIFLTKTVSDEFYLAKKRGEFKKDEYLKKISSSLKLFNLEDEYLERDINTLSKSEKRLIQYATNFIINPDIFIIDEPYLFLDKNNILNLKNIILELKRKYQKTIIILSRDINVLYELCDDLIIFDNNQVLIQDTNKKVFKDLDFLEKNQIELPDLIKFNKIAKKYNQNLTNYKDTKDLIKEVYRNVCEIKKEIQ